MLLKWLICAIAYNLSPVTAFANLNHTISYSQLIPCESGSHFFGDRCYTLYGERNGVVWVEASNFCKDKNGTLAKVDTKELNDFLSAFFILPKKVNAWIGLNDHDKESVYKWEDGSIVNYTNWAPNEPHRNFKETEDCGEIRYMHNGKIAVWNDLTCSHSEAFICQTSKNEAASSHDPRFCPIENGGGWKYLKSCYHVVPDEKPWNDAEEYCQENFKGHLLTIFGPAEEMFLDYVLPDVSKEFWIGIRIDKSMELKWSTGWHVVYNNWSDDPKGLLNGTCAVISNQIRWTSAPCTEMRPFICEVSSDKPVVLDKGPVGGRCPDKSKDWRDLGGNKCYTLENEFLKWDDANAVCMRKGGTLAVVESKEETMALHRYVEPHNSMYIGLHRSSTDEDDFEWIDGTEIGYENWRPGEPNSKAEKCVAPWTDNMEWNDVSCDTPLPFICSAKKMIVNCTEKISGRFPDGKTAAEGPDKAGYPKKMSCIKEVVGISVCAILMIVILGIVFYCIRSRNVKHRKFSTELDVIL